MLLYAYTNFKAHSLHKHYHMCVCLLPSDIMMLCVSGLQVIERVLLQYYPGFDIIERVWLHMWLFVDVADEQLHRNLK